MKIRLYLEEDSMSHALVRGLRARGVDVVTALDESMIERDDKDHLELAAKFRNPEPYPCVLTRQGKSNDPFLKLHKLWLWVKLSHATTSATHFP